MFYTINAGKKYNKFTALSNNAARVVASQFELGQSKAEQLKVLTQRKLEQRSGTLLRYLPVSTHKYFDYLKSLRKNPTKGDLIRNLIVGGALTGVILVQQGRMTPMYTLIGNCMMMSILLTRNMPKLDVPMGMNRNMVVNWSDNAFKTAVAVTALFSFLGAAVAKLLTFVLPISDALKGRLPLAASIASSAFFTLFFEVFEEKSKNGWRWKQAMENALPEDERKRLEDQVFGKATKITENFSFEYDPEIDDYPPKPKYLDEAEALRIASEKKQQSAKVSRVDQDSLSVNHDFKMPFFPLKGGEQRRRGCC